MSRTPAQPSPSPAPKKRASREAAADVTAAGAWVYFPLLWLAGASLRMTVLAVPPLLPSIHRDLRLDETLVGALTSLPTLLLAAAAVPGSLLIARVGARRALLVGLALVCLVGAVRGAGTSAGVLLACTFVMGVGVAVSQPALPSLVRLWLPERIGQGTATYSNGLLVGEIAAVALTVPLTLPLAGGRWQIDLALWSAPVALAALGVLLLTPHAEREDGAPRVRWWPDWSSGRTWRLGLILGCAASIYFGSNAFIPDYLKATHHPELITAALTSLNVVQLPSSFLVATLPGRLLGRRWPLLAAGALTLVGAGGFIGLDGPARLVCVGVLGFCSAFVLILNLSLPPLLTEPDDVHRLVAAMFTISYACAFMSSLIGGAVWDATAIPASAFAPVLLAGGGLLVLPLGLTLPRWTSIAPNR